MSPAPIVFLDIAGPDSAALREFYASVFDWEFDAESKFSVAIENPIDGVIRQDPAEKRIYLGVDDVSATLKDVVDSGGSVDVERFEVPGVVVLGLFRDPAGNPLGLVEMRDGEVVVP